MHMQRTRVSTADALPRPVPEAQPVAHAIEFDHVSLAFDDHVVLRDISFTVEEGRMLVLFGGSGTGKSLLLKMILGLVKPDAGRILLHGERIDTMSEAQLMTVRRRIGMLFQEGALFDSLTVLENVGYRLADEGLPPEDVRHQVEQILRFIGLDEYVDRLPGELSGGQRRRVAVGRAMAGNPQLLLFDDPTAGLDPIIARSVDDEIIKVRDLRHGTSMLVTHQIRDAYYVATHEAVDRNGRVAVVPASTAKMRQTDFLMLHEGRVMFRGPLEQLVASSDPYLRRFLSHFPAPGAHW